ncbi:hypothetical protein [Peredibacter starrii]|uniref:Uncharacterized protein n=1 Tax=Peredibacter starrii TaxID=28202 RepID=A0AAX4HQC8_9BACT|nr:hypothetical protein [Peredibacter starrii]WPU65441.1 hypothetical protein SOO65_01640 [Peredibacter starrii]
MDEALKGNISGIKGTVKKAWDKTSEADKTKIKEDLKNKNYSGAADTIKKNFDKGTT